MFLFLLLSLGSFSSPRADRKAATEQAPEAAQASRGHHSHHLTHVAVFIDHFVDLLNTGPRALRNALAALSVDDARVCPLVERA